MRESSLLNEDPKQLCCATKMCKRLIMGQHPNAFFWGLPLILAGMQLSVTAASQSTCYIKSSMHPFFFTATAQFQVTQATKPLNFLVKWSSC